MNQNREIFMTRNSYVMFTGALKTLFLQLQYLQLSCSSAPLLIRLFLCRSLLFLIYIILCQCTLPEKNKIQVKSKVIIYCVKCRRSVYLWYECTIQSQHSSTNTSTVDNTHAGVHRHTHTHSHTHAHTHRNTYAQTGLVDQQDNACVIITVLCKEPSDNTSVCYCLIHPSTC